MSSANGGNGSGVDGNGVNGNSSNGNTVNGNGLNHEDVNGNVANGNVAAGNTTVGNTTVPTPRAEWLAKRKSEKASGNFSQMHYARKGVVTEEMIYIAAKEKIRRNWCAMKWLADG